MGTEVGGIPGAQSRGGPVLVGNAHPFNSVSDSACPVLGGGETSCGTVILLEHRVERVKITDFGQGQAAGRPQGANGGHQLWPSARTASLLAWGNRTFLDETDDVKTVRLWEVEPGKEKAALELRRAESVAFSPDGKLLASGGGRTAKLWDVITGKEKAALKHSAFLPKV